jgi:uncharacterized membrane protein
VRSNKNAYVVSVAVALLLASVLLATYYIVIRPSPDTYVTIYLLDTNKKGADYPEFLVANVNSTFSVYVDVENHLGRTLNGTEVQVKVSSSPTPSFPLDVNATQTLTGIVKDGATWESIATISLNQPGSYLVVFELWIPNNSGAVEYSGIFDSLNVHVAAQ